MSGKTIDTLVADIEGVLLNGIPSDVPKETIEKFGQALAGIIASRLIREPKEPSLRMSNIGKPCKRQLWYEINQPGTGEPFRAETYMKFLYGDVIEELLLFLAELSGHEVKGRQDTQEIEGIKGHRDAIIDGMVVDTKSASPGSFKKFTNGTLREDDSFGYYEQLGNYVKAGGEDPLVIDKQKGGFLVLDKVGGKICLDVHDYKDYSPVESIQNTKDAVSQSEPPERGFEPKDDGYKNPKTKEFVPNGNKVLGLNCSYCDQKFNCYPDLRTFISSYGPKYFTKVVKEPKMLEITKEAGYTLEEEA